MPDDLSPRRRGRPPLDPARRLSVSVTIRLQTGDYDAAYAAARLHRSTVADLLRKALRAGKI